MNLVLPFPPIARVRIVADDLSGACDSAAALAGAGAAEVWLAHPDTSQAAVLALDADTRARPRDASALQVGAAFQALAARPAPGATLYFQKIDSTLRGHIGADLLAARAALGLSTPVILCPAFPAQHRTLRQGRAHLAGQALASTELWKTLGLASDDLAADLASQGVVVRCLDLEALRGLAEPPLLDAPAGVEALVCDAETDADLALLARAIAAQPHTWLVAGSAGLATQLARFVAPSAPPEPAIPALRDRPWLTVIGSMSAQSSRQVAVLAERAVRVACDARFLLATAGGAEWHARQQDLLRALADGHDAVVHIAGPLVSAADGQKLSQALARFVAPAAEASGGLLLSGGESARAVLDGLRISRLHQVRELMPGISVARLSAPWAGHQDMPVCIKAGAFGDDQVLAECLRRMRIPAGVPAAALSSYQKGTPCTARE